MKTLNQKEGASDEVIAHFLRIKLIHHISSMHIHESMYKTWNITESFLQISSLECNVTLAFNLIERKLNKLINYLQIMHDI